MQQHATLLANNVASCLHGVIRYEQTDAITSNIVAPTILRVVGSVLHCCANGQNM